MDTHNPKSNPTTALETPRGRRQRVAAWLNERGAALHFLVWTAAGVVYSTYLAALFVRRQFWRAMGTPQLPPA